MLKRGTAKHNRQQIEDALDQLRVEARNRAASETSLTAAGESTRGQLADVLRLTAEILRAALVSRHRIRQAEARDHRLSRREQDRSRQHGAAGARAARQSLPEGRRALPADVRRRARRIHEREARRRRSASTRNSRAAVQRSSPSSATSTPMPSRRCSPSSSGPGRPQMPYTRVPDPLVAKPARDAHARNAGQGERDPAGRARAAAQRYERRLSGDERRDDDSGRRRQFALVAARAREEGLSYSWARSCNPAISS